MKINHIIPFELKKFLKTKFALPWILCYPLIKCALIDCYRESFADESNAEKINSIAKHFESLSGIVSICTIRFVARFVTNLKLKS